MKNTRSFFDTQKWKNFVAKMYGWGASVVIIGVLFKLMHWPKAGYFLVAGLGVEAIIFFLYAFERPYKDYDWETVFPELEGGEPRQFLTALSPESVRDVARSANAESGSGQVPDAVLKRIENAMSRLVEIDPSTFAKLEQSLQRLNKTAEGMADISSFVSSTQQYTAGMQEAAATVTNLNQSFRTTAEGLQQSLVALSVSYQALALNLKNEMSKMGVSNDAYIVQLDALNKNLTALNTVYINMLTAMQCK
jgi:gliding motility-associated protein GldL